MCGNMGAVKRLTICCVVLSAILEGYTGIFLSFYHGWFNALENCTSPLSSRKDKCILEMVPINGPPAFTTIRFIDSRLAVLLEFFAQGLIHQGGKSNSPAVLAMIYLAAQFGAAWYLLVLEGMRRGNRGTILSQ